VDGIPHHARLETHHDDVFKIGVDILRWIAYSTPQELWDFLKYLAERPYFLGVECDDEFKAWKTNTLRLLLIVFVSNNDRACELMTYKLEMCEAGKDVDTVRRFYGLVYAFLSHEEKGGLHRRFTAAEGFVRVEVLQARGVQRAGDGGPGGRVGTERGGAGVHERGHGAAFRPPREPLRPGPARVFRVLGGCDGAVGRGVDEALGDAAGARRRASLTEEQCYEAIAELDKQKNI
jgi:hypothetical protein